MTRYLSLSLTLLMAACATGPVERCPDDPLVDQVRQEGRLRVIVTPDMDVTPEAELTDEAAREQRQRIEQLQDRLLAELEDTDAEVLRRFERFAMMTLEVGEVALCRLLTSELVRDVQLDQSEPPTPSSADGPG